MPSLDTLFEQDMQQIESMDAFDLHAMLQGVNDFLMYNALPVAGTSGSDRAQELFDGFADVNYIDTLFDWEQDAKAFLLDVRTAIRGADPNVQSSFDLRYSSGKTNHYFNNFQYCGKPKDFDAVTTADPIREDLRQATTFEQLEGVITGLEALAGSPEVQEYTRHVIEARINEAKTLMGQRYPDALADTTSMTHDCPNSREVTRALEAACKVIEMDPDIPEDIVSRPDGYTAKKQEAIEHRLTPHEDRLDKLAQRVADIQNLYDKMEREGSKTFGDSREYQRMKAAAASVAEYAANMDYSDPAKIETLEMRMRFLNEEAQTYADKKAYSTKMTSTGVSRKNTALALIDLTATEGRAAKFEPKDKRMSKDDKKKRTFSELVSEETQKNRDTYGHKKANVHQHLHKRTVGDQSVQRTN